MSILNETGLTCRRKGLHHSHALEGISLKRSVFCEINHSVPVLHSSAGIRTHNTQVVV